MPDLLERRLDTWIRDFCAATHVLDVYTGHTVDKRKVFASQYLDLQRLSSRGAPPPALQPHPGAAAAAAPALRAAFKMGAPPPQMASLGFGGGGGGGAHEQLGGGSGGGGAAGQLVMGSVSPTLQMQMLSFGGFPYGLQAPQQPGQQQQVGMGGGAGGNAVAAAEAALMMAAAAHTSGGAAARLPHPNGVGASAGGSA